jgi:hypothetical protein
LFIEERKNVGLSKGYKQTLGRRKKETKKELKIKMLGGRDYIYKGGERNKKKKRNRKTGKERKRGESIKMREKSGNHRKKATKIANNNNKEIKNELKQNNLFSAL